eukprot:s7054_g6.t1
MVKGPISHQGLGSKALRSTYLVKTDIGWYEDKLNNCADTVQLILERIKLDYMNVAPGMRTSASDEKIHSLQKVSRMFLLYCEDLRSKLTLEAYEAEFPRLRLAFLNACFDDHFLDLGGGGEANN